MPCLIKLFQFPLYCFVNRLFITRNVIWCCYYTYIYNKNLWYYLAKISFKYANHCQSITSPHRTYICTLNHQKTLFSHILKSPATITTTLKCWIFSITHLNFPIFKLEKHWNVFCRVLKFIVNIPILKNKKTSSKIWNWIVSNN